MSSEREKVDKCELTVLQLLEKQISTAIQAKTPSGKISALNQQSESQPGPIGSKKLRDKNKKEPFDTSINIKLFSKKTFFGGNSSDLRASVRRPWWYKNNTQ